MPTDDRKPDPLLYRKLARRYLRASCNHEGLTTLRWWRESFWVWSPESRRYSERSLATVVYDVLDWLGRKGIGSTRRMAEDTTHCLVPLVRLPDDTAMPSWLSGTSHTWHLSMQNYLVDPLAIAGGTPKAYQGHTPRWFSSVSLPYVYDRRAECPRFLEWLTTMLDGDGSAVALLQEFFGYWLTPDTSRQCALFLVGEGGTGKSTLIHVAKNLIGTGNCAFLGISDLGRDFAIASTEGKLLDISDETGDLPANAESIFKWWLGGTEMQLERKFADRRTFKPTARLLVAMNPPGPRIRDMTEAVYRRIRILPMNHRIDPHNYDVGLWSRLLEELPGIFNWAVRGLARVTEKGFSDCSRGEELLQQCRVRSQPHTEFVSDCVVRKTGGFVTSANLRSAYTEWCQEQGVRANMDTAALSRVVCRQIATAMVGRRRVGQKQVRGIENVALA